MFETAPPRLAQPRAPRMIAAGTPKLEARLTDVEQRLRLVETAACASSQPTRLPVGGGSMTTYRVNIARM